MNITNSFVAGTVHLRSLLRFPDLSACFQTPGDLAAMSACPLCFFVATWSQSSSPTCSKPGTHCTHHLKPYMYNNRSHKIGVETGCPRKKGKTMKFLKWHRFCVPARVGVTLLPWYAVPKILSQRIPASDHWWKRMWRTFAQNPFVDTRLLNLHHRNFRWHELLLVFVCVC